MDTKDKKFSVEEAVKIISDEASKKFVEAIDVAVNLGIDPIKTDQAVRGATNLPHGSGKTYKVAVFAEGDEAKEAKDAGADMVGMEDLADDMKKGNIDYDVIIATPETMRIVSPLGQILGPKGLMPNPKLGTVTDDIKKAVTDAKSGQVELRNDKDGNIGLSLGKKSFDNEKIIKNFKAVIDALTKEKANNTLKGDLIKNTYLTSTMGVSYKLKLDKSI